MDLLGFFKAVLPTGLIVLARKVIVTDSVSGKSFPSMLHRTAQRRADAVGEVARMMQSGTDVYFALATFKQGFHTAEINGKTKKVIRVRPNVADLKSFWFDIDFKELPQAQVGAELKRFCKATGLPVPSIMVNSGNGIHVYWPLDAQIPVDTWQPLADALKAAAAELEFKVDLACTADACRVLRPPTTVNLKDPNNHKPVKIIYSNDTLFPLSVFETALAQWIGQTPTHKASAAPKASKPDVNDDLTGGTTRPTLFENIRQQCAVAQHAVDSHGSDAKTSEWRYILQLLKNCNDGEEWIHEVSSGHEDYTPEATEQKFAQRSGGPTLCKTFESVRPELCKACPHYGKLKSPAPLGFAPPVAKSIAAQEAIGLPKKWRVSPTGKGLERIFVEGTGDNKVFEWRKVLRHIPIAFRSSKSIVTREFSHEVDVTLPGGKPLTLEIGGEMLGNHRKLGEHTALYGVSLIGNELKEFGEIMSTWLEKLQEAKEVADVTEQLGWLLEDKKPIAFSCGVATFYKDGRIRDDVKASREFTNIAKHYNPVGSIEPWKKVASFLAEQNNPAFTAILAASFGAPLLRFTGHSGALLSIVSTASGVGKSSALKCSQAVWGSPIHGVNAVDDTPKSVARKLGFLNNLPAYWDELRGKQTIEQFVSLAFQVTQGKERTRLDSSANLREVATWETMLIVASNESVLEAMARKSGHGSDAGTVRTFEMTVEPFESATNKADISLMFEPLAANYGHAGAIYAQYLAVNADKVAKAVRDLYSTLGAKMPPQERFWYAVIAVLLVGARIAKELDLVDIDLKTLHRYLIKNLGTLRASGQASLQAASAVETLSAFMLSNQDKKLVVRQMPGTRQNSKGYLPEVLSIPKAGKLAYVVSQEPPVMRVSLGYLESWCGYRELAAAKFLRELRNELNAKDMRVRLGIGTDWELPPVKCLEIPLDGPLAGVMMQEPPSGEDGS